jgi:hypothetical protein
MRRSGEQDSIHPIVLDLRFPVLGGGRPQRKRRKGRERLEKGTPRCQRRIVGLWGRLESRTGL